MSLAIETAIKQTQQAFIHGVWPRVAEAIGGGRIIPVEAISDKKFLDLAGIDHWHVLESRNLIRGIASRCQWPKYKRWQAFTIRVGNKAKDQTELAKRLYALKNAAKGWMRPHLFIQAFFAPPHSSYDTFLYAGIARMDDVLTLIRDGKRGRKGEHGCDWYMDETSEKWGQTDAKQFAVVPFDSLTRNAHEFRLVTST
jgi:hypothetical protein